MPNRGAIARNGHVYVVFAMPCPESTSPFVGFPVPGTMAPIDRFENGPSSSPVTGFIACRFAPEHGFTLPTHPAAYNNGAAPRLHLSTRKFDTCPSESYCGC